MGESIGIGLEASSNSKGPQAKTTEPMDSNKVTYCSIQLCWILARDGFAKNAMGFVQRQKRAIFTLSNAKHGRKYWNRSRGKLAFTGLSGKDYGTHGLN